MRRGWMVFLLLLSLSPALAHASPSTVLFLPVALRGDFQPIDEASFDRLLAQRLGQGKHSAKLLHPGVSDLQSHGFSPFPSQPTASQCRRLCSVYSAQVVVWVSMRFQAQAVAPQGLAITGAARLWAWNVNRGLVTIDETTSVLATSTDASPNQQALAEACIHDLGDFIIGIAKQRSVAQVANSWPVAQAPTPTSNAGDPTALQNMRSCLQAYQTAINRQDYIATTTHEREAVAIWRSLTADQQQQINHEFPGIVGLLEGGQDYRVDGLYYYHPQYYGRRR